MRTARTLSVLTVLLLVLGTVSAGAPATSGSPTGSYIVVFEPGVSDVAVEATALARAHGGQVGFIYEHALQGFSITTSPRAAAAIARSPRVAYVEVDSEVSIAAQKTPTGIQRIFADDNGAIGIDGIDDQRVDVDVAVIDTGVDFQHPDLNVYTEGSVNCTGGSPFRSKCSSGGDDDHYHGTHVAGTIGALDNGIGVVGVAPGARIWAVKVLDSRGLGYTSQVVAGIDYVAKNAGAIEVANMSLGGRGFSQAEYDAIQGAVNKGVAFAVAAGNDGDDANNYSPAAFDNVLTVSALADFDGEPGKEGDSVEKCLEDQDDTFAYFSNYGDTANKIYKVGTETARTVPLIAPGVCILSTVPGGYGTLSGTSMASPHVAGALALLASGTSAPSDDGGVYGLYATVITAGNIGWDDADDPDSFKEPLLDVSTFVPTLVATGDGGGGDGDTNSTPMASFTYSCNDLICDFTDTSTDDGTVASWSWNFGDGNTSTTQSPSHTYSADDTYSVTLTVTDDDGAIGSDTQNVTVPDPDGSQLVGSTTSNGKTWTATVRDSSDTVFSGTFDTKVSCSDATECSTTVRKNIGSVTFTATDERSITILKP